MTDQRIKKVLIANRGEIAVRVIRTCQDLGIRSVAVFSEADRGAPHVRLADEAYLLGPAPSSESYLSMERILQVARHCEADAVHPGYGFLSENAGFAEACAAAGLIFIGPPPNAMRAMGDKTAARTLMAEAGVPMAPGTTDAVQDVEEAERIAAEIGFPVIIKAAAGGGGRGMRVVTEAKEFGRSLDMARGEAQTAFGDGRVFIERYIEEPRHIEFQIIGDRFGNMVHLFERECSIQRRHQKLVEEAPSSVLTADLRKEMGEAAVRAARACGYFNAGTVEFLLDSDMNFFFMEMNTRLQVEHPVTESITGLDLVAEQIRVAEGRPLSIKQANLKIRGHAIECRINAESPINGFLPEIGTITRYVPPTGPGVRVDSGVEQGGEVSRHYDAMIAKLITFGRDRAEAIQRMERALGEYTIQGVDTTIPFARFVMGHPAFREGHFSTRFVERYFDPEKLLSHDETLERAAALAATLHHNRTHRTDGANAPVETTLSATPLRPPARTTWVARRRT